MGKQLRLSSRKQRKKKMPRIYTSASDPIDFCQDCFPSEDEAVEEYGLEQCGEGPDNRGDCFDYNSYHPEYEGSGYTCEKCGKELTLEDE